MGYTMNSDDVYGLASALGAQTQRKGDELFFKRCPYCDGGGHDDNTFSVNLVTGAFKCFRYSCNKQGHFVEMARDFSYPLEFDDGKEKAYNKLPQMDFKPKDKAIEYLQRRGISDAIGYEYKITIGNKKSNVLLFPFYDENNILTFVKYRDIEYSKEKGGNKEWCAKGCKPILFGMAQCDKEHKRLIVTEGQLDSLSVASAGFKNAVSVPTGQSGFTWVNFCHDWVNSFEEIIIFGDNEKGHITLVDGFLKHFGQKKLRVVRSEDYLGEKDANDILRKYGAGAIKTCIDNAVELMTNHVVRLDDVKSVDLEAQEHIKTGIFDVDKVIGGLYMGSVTVLTGRRGEGKSTLASQIIANALDQKDPNGQPYSVFIYSGELPNYHFKRWLDLQIAGSNHIITSTNGYGTEVYDLAEDTVAKINAWYHDRAYIYDNNIVLSEMDTENKESLVQTIEKEIQRHDVKLVLIDNLMTAIDVDLDIDLYRAQSKFVNMVKRLALKYNVAVLLIAHPRKGADDGKLTNESISGSGDITNRVDTVLTYAKVKDAPDKGNIGIVKNRLTGNVAEDIKVRYGKKSKRIGCNNSEWDREYGCFKEPEIEEEVPPF